MAVIQNNFADDLAKGYPGMEADGSLSNIMTRHLEGVTAAAFGAALYRGVADKGTNLNSAGGPFIGWAIAKKGLPVTSTRPVDSYAPGDNVAVKERGTIWVNVSVAVVDDDQVYVTAGGVITNSAAGNVVATGWKFKDTLAAPGVGRVVRL